MKAVLFDLDGTLIDSLGDIADAANAALDYLGLPGYPEAAYRQFVGSGVRTLVTRMLPEITDETMVERVVAAFRNHYWQHWNTKTTAYPGIMELLSDLQERDLFLTVLSNKPDDFARTCTREFFPEIPFAYVFGQRQGVPRKPDPAGAIEIAARLGVQPDQCLFVGDTAVDMHTGLAAGMCCIGVSWGFRSRQELEQAGAHHIIDTPQQLLDYVDGPL